MVVWHENMINEHTWSDTVQLWLLNKFFKIQRDSFDGVTIKLFIIFNWNRYWTYPNKLLMSVRTLCGCNGVNNKHSRWRFECHDKGNESVHQYFIFILLNEKTNHRQARDFQNSAKSVNEPFLLWVMSLGYQHGWALYFSFLSSAILSLSLSLFSLSLSCFDLYIAVDGKYIVISCSIYR